MGSIRPLFTITVLVLVGAYLYTKINEGPVRPHAAPGAAAQTPDGVPPLAAAGGGATLAQDSTAPAWPPSAPSAGSAAPVLPPGVTTDGTSPSKATAESEVKDSLPEVPPIPELPELPKTADATSPETPTTAPLPTVLPANVPGAHYGDEQGPDSGASSNSTAASNATASTVSQAGTTAPANASAASSLSNTSNGDVAVGSAVPPPNGATMPAATTPPLVPASSSEPKLSPSDTAINSSSQNASDDRYAINAASAATTAKSPTVNPVPNASPASTAPAAATFAASWPAIQAALDRNDLKQAHLLLSKWHNDDTLTSAESQKVETLLGQLAGTVIYSTEHQLEPARVVKLGETLETIAKEYNVPWQLLSKINSIPAPDQVRPGQALKVVRGPFSATVDLHRNELTLDVDGRYAGTFPVTVPPGATVAEGQWRVDQKVAAPQNAVTPTAYAAPAAPAEPTIVLRNASNAGVAAPGSTLTISSGSTVAAPTSGSSSLRVSPQDAEDLSDILSIGSRVIVRK